MECQEKLFSSTGMEKVFNNLILFLPHASVVLPHLQPFHCFQEIPDLHVFPKNLRGRLGRTSGVPLTTLDAHPQFGWPRLLSCFTITV